MASHPELLFWTMAGGFGLATAYTLVRFFGFLRRDRFVEDTPLVRIRSAAQGYVRIEGLASSPPGENLTSPLSDRACVWWDYEVAERHKNSKGQTEWRIVDQARSVTPFQLADADADGQCLIGPVGAEITPTANDTWFGELPKPTGPPSEFGAFGAIERNYRYRERIIAPGARLSVLGELRSQSNALEIDAQVRDLLIRWKSDQAQLLERFDRNHDGRIDAAEWEAARAAARNQAQATLLETPIERISVVGQTRHGEPFLIAPLDERQLIRRERRYAAASLLMSTMFLALAAWAIRRAIAVHTAL